MWCQTADGKIWNLMRSEVDPKTNTWSVPKAVVTQGNPRFCSAAYDSDDHLWVAYSKAADPNREIAVQKIE